jgi:DNA-binding transcriptional ArsR family regulator
MGRYSEEGEQGLLSLPSATATFAQLKAGSSLLAQRILALLAERPRYSHEIAKELRVHEQKIYYHVRRLVRAHLIVPERRLEIGGATAKYYALAAPAFSVLLQKPQPSAGLAAVPEAQRRFLAPFIVNGRADFLIVVGSPEPHGPQMARAKDGSYAVDLALFLGSFLAQQPGLVLKLDTDFRQPDWNNNLIIIGGPIVNTIADRVNAHVPIRFSSGGKAISSVAGKRQYEGDEIGIIVKAPNPFAHGKHLLFIAGRRQAGTKAAILAFLKHFDRLSAAPRTAGVLGHIVEGRDLDSDGVVDEVRFRE